MLLFNVSSGAFTERHWIGVWSKCATCQCGCFGRCTFGAFWRLLNWVATVWLAKVYPAFRDDGKPFEGSTRRGDKKRAYYAKQRRRMHVRGAFLQKRGDWAWFKQVMNLVN